MKRYLFASLLAVAAAFGGTVTYTFKVEAAGDVAGVSFIDLVTVKTDVDSAAPTTPLGPSSLMIGALAGTIDLSYFFVNPTGCSIACAGVGQVFDFLDADAPFFQTYVAGTPTAVIPSAQFVGNIGASFTTSLGQLSFNRLGPGTFQATTDRGGPGAVPEPATLAMALAGLTAVAVRHFRR